MAVEFARMRIAKIRNEVSYSRKDLNNKLGFSNKSEDSSSSTIDLFVGCSEIR